MVERGNKENLTNDGERMNEAANISSDEDNIIELEDIAVAPSTEAEDVIVLTEVADLASNENNDIGNHAEMLTDSSVQDGHPLTFGNVTQEPRIKEEKALERTIIPGNPLKDSEMPVSIMNRGENFELESVNNGAFPNENAVSRPEAASGAGVDCE